MTRWIIFTLLAFAWLAPAHADELPLAKLKLPPGFEVELFARVDNARQMALGKNTLFVGSRRAGKVYAIPLTGARTPVVIAEGLTMPVGVAFRDGDLYVSAVSRVLRLRNIEAQLAKPPRPETVSAAWPTETHHGWKFIAFGPAPAGGATGTAPRRGSGCRPWRWAGSSGCRR